MDIVIIDFGNILICLVLAVAIYLFYLSFAVIDPKANYNEAFAVIDVINLLKKACPLGTGNKWQLLRLDTGHFRCWMKRLLCPIFRTTLQLYGGAVTVPCSSVYAFTVISDVTNWGEWEPTRSSQYLLVKPFFDRRLSKDSYMLADQVVGVQRGTNVQSYTALYRFLGVAKKESRWILFWNAKKMEFIFFLIEPSHRQNAKDQTVITHILGTTLLASCLTSLLAQRLRNIVDFISFSQLGVASCRPADLPVTEKYSSKNLKLLDETCHKIPPPSQHVSLKNDNQSVFFLVPVLSSAKCAVKNLRGFQLLLRKFDDKSKTKKLRKRGHSYNLISKSHHYLKRAASDIGIQPSSCHTDFNCNTKELKPCHQETIHAVEKGNHGLGYLTSNCDVATKKHSTLCTANSESNNNCESNEQNETITSGLTHKHKLRSVSETAVHNLNQYKTNISSNDSDIQSDEADYSELHVADKCDNGNLLAVEEHNYSEMFHPSDLDFENLVSDQKDVDGRMPDYLTHGNYGAAELQAEMMLASRLDPISSVNDQFYSGGWSYHSSYKGIPVFSKKTSNQFMQISSFLCQTEIPSSPKDVWKFVKNPRFRFICDETVKNVDIMLKISSSQKLIYTYHETSGLFKKEFVDFCLLQTEREEKNCYYSAFHSIEYDKCPFVSSVLRGILRPSGWIIEENEENPEQCKVTYLIQFLINSPDSLFIQDLSTLVPQSLHNLKNYVTSKPL